MIAWLKRWWQTRVQATMGFIEMGAGLLEFIDANTINLVGSFLGPKYGPIVSKAIQVLAGLLTAYRAMQVAKKPPP